MHLTWQHLRALTFLLALAMSPQMVHEDVRVDTPTIVPLYHRAARVRADSDSVADPAGTATQVAATLGTAARVLEPYGVRFILVDADTVVLRWRSGKTRRFGLPARARAAYVFAGPPDVYAVELGDLTDTAVVCAAKRHFDLRGTIQVRDTQC